MRIFLILFLLPLLGICGEKMRIVSLAPSITETLIEMGRGDEIVGHTQYCPSQAKGVNLGRSPVSLEAILRCRPTLVLVTDTRLSASQLKKSTLANIHYMKWSTVADIKASWQRIGQLVGREDKARAMVENFDKALLAMKPNENHQRKSILLVVSLLSANNNSSVWAAGSDSFFNSAVVASGHVNTLPSAKAWQKLSLEGLLALQADKIVVIQTDLKNASVLEGEKAAWRRLDMLDAVRHKQVYFLGGDDVVRSGPSLIKVLQRLHKEIR